MPDAISPRPLHDTLGMRPAGSAPLTASALARLTGLPVVASHPIGVGLSNRTDVATLDDGRLVVVQRPTDQVLARPRIEALEVLAPRLRAAGIPVPDLLAVGTGARPPFVVTGHVPGRPGSEGLRDAVEAIALGSEMGRLVRTLGSVPTDGLRLPATWARPDVLAAVAGRWLARTTGLLPPSVHGELAAAIASLPDRFGGRRPVLAHGDWAPVNVLVERRAVVAVVDWEFARLADPLFDVAWWGSLVMTFHPDAWPHAWPAFLETAGVDLDAPTVHRLRILGPLRMLEVLASRRVLREPAAAEAWAERLVRLVDTAG